MNEKVERFAEQRVRRDFLGLAALWSFLLTGVTMALGALRLPMPSVFPETGKKFRIGPPDRFPVGSTTVIADRNVIIGSDEGGIFALSLVCTHLGCITRREPSGEFTCPCHGSRFDAQGEVIAGPAPGSLHYLQVSRAPSGDLIVDADAIVDASSRLSTGGPVA